MTHTEAVQANRELWFQQVPGAREAYLSDPHIRTTLDSVDSALSMVDRALARQGVPETVRLTTLYYAVFRTEMDDADEARRRIELDRVMAETERRVSALYDAEPGTVYGIRPHRYRPEDDRLRKLAAEIPPPPAPCHVQTPHPAHHWADRGLHLFACSGWED